jgi:hypothetical protein
MSDLELESHQVFATEPPGADKEKHAMKRYQIGL